PVPELLALLTGSGLALFPRLAEIHLAEDGAVDLVLRDPVRVRLGPLATAPAKLPILKAILDDLSARGAQASEIDLRLEAPVIRSREPLPAGPAGPWVPKRWQRGFLLEKLVPAGGKFLEAVE